MRFQTCLLAIALSAVPTFGQSVNVPSAATGFVTTKEPVRDGVRVVADLPTSQHHRNVGGSDGAGLCVYTSAWHAALWQSVSELYGFRDWMTRRPGGSYPEKFEKTLSDYCREKGIPCPGYVQHTGGEVEFLELALKTGRMVCVTYCGVDGDGRYGNEVIGHMVNLVHLDANRAAILDNNFPGSWLWMSREAFVSRWRGVQPDGRPFLARMGTRWMPIGGGWAIVLVSSPPTPYPAPPAVQNLARACEIGDCTCNPDTCECEKNKRKCPAQCPVLIGQQKQPLTYAEVHERVKAGKRVTLSVGAALKGKAEGHIDALPGFTVGIYDCFLKDGKPVMQLTCPDGRCPLRPKPKADAVEPDPVHVGEFPQGGVVPDRLTAGKRYWCNGEPCTKEEAHAALLLTDDSQRWNLAIVGEPNFARKVRDDLGTLPADVRVKLHVQSYTPGDWPVSQFSLGPGVTLRKPAVGRVGSDLGTVPVSDYSAVRLADLLASDGGPTAKPKVAPEPRPKIDPQPGPNVEPVPAPMPKPNDPIPEPSRVGILAILAAMLALLFWPKRK